MMSTKINDLSEKLAPQCVRSVIMAERQETLADYVRRVIKEKGLNYRLVSRQSGGQISHTTVGDIVSGAQKGITVETLQALARGLGVDEDEIFEVARGKTPQDEEGYARSLFYKAWIHYQETDDEDEKQFMLRLMQKNMLPSGRKKTS